MFKLILKLSSQTITQIESEELDSVYEKVQFIEESKNRDDIFGT